MSNTSITIDLSKVLLSAHGEPLTIKTPDAPASQLQVRVILWTCASVDTEEDSPVNTEAKLSRYKLLRKLEDAGDGELELSADDCEFYMKRAAYFLSAYHYGRFCELLAGTYTVKHKE
jgi:hypothetical protein